MESLLVETSSIKRTRSNKKLWTSLLVSILILSVLNTIFSIYGYFFLLPEKINELTSLLGVIGGYGDKLNNFTTEFNNVYKIINGFCNNTGLCT